MKLSLRANCLQEFIGFIRYTLFAVGVAMLAYCAYIVADTQIFQAGESRRLEDLLRFQPQSTGRAGTAALPRDSLDDRRAPIQGALIGRIDIPMRSWDASSVDGITYGSSAAVCRLLTCPGKSAP